MIQRVTQRIGNGLGPLLKLLPVRGILAGDVFLLDTVSTHGTPLIVVATQPQLGDTLEAVVVGHHLRIQVTVIVNDGHLSRMVVKQVLCYLVVEHEVLVIEWLHNLFDVYCFSDTRNDAAKVVIIFHF